MTSPTSIGLICVQRQVRLSELLSEDEVELRTSAIAGLVFVEAPAPVDTEQAEHRQIDADTDTGRAFQIEWVELLEVAPAVTGFEKRQRPDIGRLIEQQRVSELDCEFGIQITVITIITASSVRSQRTGGITAHANHFDADVT